MCDDYAVAFLYLAAEDAFASIFLRVEDNGRTFEVQKFWSNACSLYDATVLSDIAEEDSHAAVFHVGMFYVAYAAVFSVGVEFVPVCFLRTHDIAELPTRCTTIDVANFFADRCHRVVAPCAVCIECETGDRILLYVFAEC